MPGPLPRDVFTTQIPPFTPYINADVRVDGIAALSSTAGLLRPITRQVSAPPNGGDTFVAMDVTVGPEPLGGSNAPVYGGSWWISSIVAQFTLARQNILNAPVVIQCTSDKVGAADPLQLYGISPPHNFSGGGANQPNGALSNGALFYQAIGAEQQPLPSSSAAGDMAFLYIDYLSLAAGQMYEASFRRGRKISFPFDTITMTAYVWLSSTWPTTAAPGFGVGVGLAAWQI